MKRENLKEKLYARNYTKHGFDLNVFVSIVSAILVLTFILFTVVAPELSTSVFNHLNDIVVTNFNWLYVLTINAAFIFVIVIGLSKYGKIKIGGFRAKPEFSNFSWYAMLFSAGIGIAIFFYGVAEPIYHQSIPDALSSGSEFDNFKVTYLNWGFHAWATYSLMAIGLGYFAYNKGLPFSLRSLFYPLIKDKIFGIWGDIIDTIAVLSVLFGLATSLGLGARQINSGLEYVLGIPFNSKVQTLLIIVITFFAILSVVSGISKGIKYLSQANMIITGVLLTLVLLVGPTTYILATYFTSFGLYVNEFALMGGFVATTPEDIAWQSAWTVFYWAWWISWTPFVGAFIARISKGRTIREIAIGSVVVPTIIITFAMTILGASGVYLNELNDNAISMAIDRDISTAMFEMFKYLSSSPIVNTILSAIAIVAIVLFFVTSSDSGSLVVDNLTSGGKEDSPKTQRVFWACVEGAIALSVLLLGGEQALTTLQTAIILTALPFSLLFLTMIFSLLKEFKESYKKHQYNSTVKLKRQIDDLDHDVQYKI